jgi:hypothetical protein
MAVISIILMGYYFCHVLMIMSTIRQHKTVEQITAVFEKVYYAYFFYLILV